MSKKRRDLTAEEKTLWRRVTASARPRRPSGAAAAPVDPPPIAVQRPPKPAAPPQPKRSPSKASPPADRGGEKRVRRGKVDIDATLDLHGYTQDAAFRALATFVSIQRRRGARIVLVITGSGRGGEGVLKRRLPEWIGGAELKPNVAGFAQAHRQHGGAGAFYVFLKRA